jgi:hypothetical protein
LVAGARKKIRNVKVTDVLFSTPTDVLFAGAMMSKAVISITPQEITMREAATYSTILMQRTVLIFSAAAGCAGCLLPGNFCNKFEQVGTA